MDELPRPVLQETIAERCRSWLLRWLAPSGPSVVLQPDETDLLAFDAVPEAAGDLRSPLAERPVLAVVAVAALTATLVLGGAWATRQLAAWQARSSVAAEELLPIVEPVAPPPFADGAAPAQADAVGPDDLREDSMSEVLVHVAGAVRRPGVVSVATGGRVVDAVDAAGGPTADADLDRLNLAASMDDGERIHVPAVGQPTPTIANPQHAVGDVDAEGAGPVDLNVATGAALETLNGVGPATASAILDYRDRNGPFLAVDDLLNVPGIGPAKLEALRSQVIVG